VTAGYSGTPLPKKMGIKPGAKILLLDAPELAALHPLPDGVIVHRRAASGPYEVIMAFCPDTATLRRRFNPALLTTAGALWVCWPKKASGVSTDLGEGVVRSHGLASGLVDVKVAAIDEVWSGLKFVRRLAAR
jgi:hypothetical protein